MTGRRVIPAAISEALEILLGRAIHIALGILLTLFLTLAGVAAARFYPRMIALLRDKRPAGVAGGLTVQAPMSPQKRKLLRKGTPQTPPHCRRMQKML